MIVQTGRRLAIRRLPSTMLRTMGGARRHASPLATLEPKEKDLQLGDYPDLPYISRQYLPAKGWWDNQMRRNYGDTLHDEEELLSMWGPDIPIVPPRTALFQFSLAVLMFVGIGFTAKALVPEKKAVPRQYPYDGLVGALGGLEANKAMTESLEDDEE